MFHFQENLQKGSIEKSCLYQDNNLYKIQKGFVKLDELVKSLILLDVAHKRLFTKPSNFIDQNKQCNWIKVMDGPNRERITPGMQVLIVMKKDQRTGKLTEGAVKDILTKSKSHPYGIKVRLESGQIGRVKKSVSSPI